MKRVLLIMAVVISTVASAQNFGLKAGVNFSTFKGEMRQEYKEMDGYSLGYQPGFHAFGTFEYGFNNWFGLETGLGVSTKGTKLKYDVSYEDLEIGYSYRDQGEQNLNIYYGQIPIKLKFGLDIGETRLFTTVGGYFGIGFSGKLKSNSEYEGNYNGNIETYSEKSEYKFQPWEEEVGQLDAGVSASIGAEYKGFVLEAGYEYGLINPYDMDDLSYASNSVIGISLGYKFGTNKAK